MPKASESHALSPAVLKAYEHLKEIRASKTVSLKPCSMLRQEIVGLDGKPQPLRLRYYQVQGIYHMLVLKRMVLGDGTGLGKTIQAIGALCYLWEKEPNNKAIVVAPKSAIRQWADEIQRFSVGVKPIIALPRRGESPGEARKRAYSEWANAPTGPEHPKVVLILNYAILVRDWNLDGFRPLKPNGRPDPKQPVVPGLLDKTTAIKDLVVIFDEASAFKGMNTKTWETCRYLSDRAERVYGLTATLLKNRLFEGYAIYQVIKPGLFTTKTKFYEDFCYVELKKSGKARIPIILGYKNLDKFREIIDPFFLGRAKHMVSDELPTLTTREVICELSEAEDAKYEEALSGVLELGDGEVREFEETKALTSLIYCQQVVNSLSLLKLEEGSGVVSAHLDLDTMDHKVHRVGKLGSKEEALLDLVTGELEDEKIIVYTRFASLVPRLQEVLKQARIKSTRITGKESEKARRTNQQLFQDLESDTKVIFITDAGSEAINLQAASAMIFYDAPWSWGGYIQLIGRMIRIGSPHKGVLAFHLIAERPTRTNAARKTIDAHVLALLRKKKGLIDKVLGEAAVGALTFEDSGTSIRDLLRAMQQQTDPGTVSV